MGNANGREQSTPGAPAAGGRADVDAQSPAISSVNSETSNVVSSDSMGNTPPHSPGKFRSPILFAPQIPVAPLQGGNGPTHYNGAWQNECDGAIDSPPEQGIPTIITWSYGGSNVAVEGSWDNWASRKTLQRTGKDFSLLMVLPSGVYHYKFIVDGQRRYIPDLPFIADEMGNVFNLLNVSDSVPDILQSVAEFEPPQSPETTYSQTFPTEEDFAKEPAAVPSQLHLTVLGMENADEASSSKPQHVVLNHLFIEKGWASQSVVALGLTHRFHSKYVTVVLYKPLNR
ncbi:SNF1-related protein kinase regulatory subunit beta-1 [Cucumis melo var. makuwa]|uniref:SNF1-related protein kinase regulatory subunit beta-1 n=2 Tax=Cucumis melo TaxID=3656 RepID=A0A5A7UKJ0_CUCMM|nr:SNF1-related protein kinase regulatory subunit beta-1 [Cucumis melo]KAA0055694.1 SNF1-related protein kinase regulatory subunit beta-1 [Cucumis melo var. makuwa]